jgi:hypothetical protein
MKEVATGEFIFMALIEELHVWEHCAWPRFVDQLQSDRVFDTDARVGVRQCVGRKSRVWERKIYDLIVEIHPRQADPRIMLQKLTRLKCGSLSASTSALTLPKVVSGLCLLPS